MFFYRKVSLCLLSIMVIGTSFPMMEGIKSFNPIQLLQDNKTAALLTGLGVLGTSIFGYTTYKLWQKHKQLNHTLAINNQRAQAFTFNSNFVTHSNEMRQLNRQRNQEINYYQQLLQNGNEEKRKLMEEIERLRILQANPLVTSPQPSFKAKGKKDKGKEKIDDSADDALPIIDDEPTINIPISHYIEREKDKLEQEFVELDGDYTVKQENNNAVSSSNNVDMSASLNIESLLPQKAQTNYFKNYELSGTKIINNRINTDKTIALIIIHGTFVNSDEYGKIEDFAISQSLLEFAKKLARDQECHVAFTTFNWSGELNSAHRKDAGSVLAQFIRDHGSKDQDIWTIEHSHGANVLYHTSEELRSWGPIKYAINIASPLIDCAESSDPIKTTPRTVKNAANTLNIENLINIYSTGDLTQLIGSCQTALFKGSYSSERRAPFIMNTNRKVWNIRLQDNGHELNHLSIIIPAIRVLPKLLPVIKRQFAHIHDLDVNNDHQRQEPQVVIRNLIRSEGCTHEEIIKSLEYSDESALQFEETYNRNIRDKVQYTVVKVVSETKDALACLTGKFCRLPSVKALLSYFSEETQVNS